MKRRLYHIKRSLSIVLWLNISCLAMQFFTSIFVLLLLTSNIVRINAYNAPLRLGLLLEEAEYDQMELENALEWLKPHLNITFDVSVKTYFYRDPFTILTQACKAIQEGATFLISSTSCEASEVLQTMTHQLSVPHIFLPRFTDCYKFPYASSTSFPMRVNYSLVGLRLGNIFAHDDWNNYMLMYDDYFAQSYVNEIEGMLKKSASETRDDEISGKKIRMYDRETTGDMQDTLIEIHTLGLYTNFVVMASQENTLKLLRQAEKLGLLRLSYKWVLVNIDLDVSQLTGFNPQFNALLITRKLPSTAYEDPDSTQSFVKQDWKGVSDLGFNRNFSYILNAGEIALIALNQTRNAMNTNFDSIRNTYCYRHSPFMEGPKIINQIHLVKMDKAGNVDIFGIINDYMGFSFFKPQEIGSKPVLEEPVLQESQFQVFANLEMLRYDMRLTGPVQSGWKKIDEWNSEMSTSYWSVPKNANPFRIGKTSLDGSTLKITTVVEEPFIIRKSTPQGEVYDGYCIDILKAIQQRVASEFNEHFTYEIKEDPESSYGILDKETREWNGMVGQLMRGEADLAVAGMTRNYDREKVIDYTAAYMDYGVGILIRKPQPVINIYGFLDPITPELWCYILLCGLATSVLLYLLAKLSPYERLKSPGVYTLPNSVWWVMGALMLQGGDYNPRSLSNRCLCNIIWMFSVLLVSIYTANLAAFLTIAQLTPPIESLRDLASQSVIAYGTIDKTSLSTFFQEQAEKDPLYQQLWDYMNKTRPSPMVRDLQEGYDRALKSGYAFMWDYPVLQYQKKRNCDYMTVGKPFNKKKYAFAVPKGSSYLTTITLSILSLQEMGILAQIGEKWFDGDSSCVEGDGGSNALTYDNIGGIFWILLFGCGVAIFINILERVWYKFIEKRSHCDFPRVMGRIRAHFRDHLLDEDESF